jgi:hypothetical protein
MKIVILYGGSFAGETYTLQVDDKFYHLCTNGGGKPGNEEAQKLAQDKLTELGVSIHYSIPFEWNKCM